MENTQLKQSSVSCFDVENTELNIKLKNYNTATGTTRDQLARSLMRDFMHFIETAKPVDQAVHGVSPELRALVASSIEAYANGGSFDLHIGGVCNEAKPQGRPRLKGRDRRIRDHLVELIDLGLSVTSAAQQCVQELKTGRVRGLPVLQISAGTIRRIWYASTQQQLFDSRMTNDVERDEVEKLVEAASKLQVVLSSSLRSVAMSHNESLLQHKENQ